MSTPAEKRETSPVNDLEARVIRLEERSTNAATKEDIANFRADIANTVNVLGKEIAAVNANLGKEIAAVNANLSKEIAAVNANLGKEIAAVKEDVANLRADIANAVNVLGKEIAAVKEDVAETRGKLSNIPTTLQIIAIMVTLLFAATGASFALLRFGVPMLGH